MVCGLNSKWIQHSNHIGDKSTEEDCYHAKLYDRTMDKHVATSNVNCGT